MRTVTSAVARGERIGTLTSSEYTSPSLGIVLKIPVSAERVVGDLAAKDYVEAGRALTRQRPGVTAVSEVAIERIGNAQFTTSTVTMGSGQDATFMKTYARRHRDKMLMVVLWYAGSRQRYESEQLLGSIQYQ